MSHPTSRSILSCFEGETSADSTSGWAHSEQIWPKTETLTPVAQLEKNKWEVDVHTEERKWVKKQDSDKKPRAKYFIIQDLDTDHSASLSKMYRFHDNMRSTKGAKKKKKKDTDKCLNLTLR